MKAVIMAGGLGTRIASVNSDVPKPMIPVLGKPILEYQIENLKFCGLMDIILVTGHLGHIIRDYFGDGSVFGVDINYFEEWQPLGTAGALFQMRDALSEDFLLLNGDLIMDVDFGRFIAFHRSHNALASLMSHPNSHPYDSSLLVTDSESRVIRWMSKEDDRLYYKNRVNAGVQIISPELLAQSHPSAPKVDLDRELLKPALASGRIFAYDTPEYIKDMGTPDRLKEVEADLASGKVKARNLSHKQKAVFLDRDGTLNRYVGFLTKPEQLELLPGAAEGVRAINRSGYLAIVVTNQPVIARGECTFETLDKIHDKLETELGKSGAYLDAIYLCPHHPDSGFEGERPEFKIDCDCRKPKPGLLLRAAEDFNIDLSQSIMIGDGERDVQAGVNAGCKASCLLPDDETLPDVLEKLGFSFQ